MIIRNEISRELAALVVILAVSPSGCSTHEETSVDADALDREPAEYRSSEVELIKIGTQIDVGRPLYPITLERPKRSANELSQRVLAAATQVSGTPIDARGLTAWCVAALEDRHDTAVARPLEAHPDIVVSYQPYLDYLSVLKTTQASAVGSLFSRAEAEQVARATVAELGTMGVIEGEHVLARSGTIAMSAERERPYATDYAFHYFRTIDGILVNDSWVEVYVNADLAVSKLAVRGVEVVSLHPPTTAPRDSQAVEAELRSLIEAEVAAISPHLMVNVLSQPMPAYHLEPYEEKTVSVPELTVRWSTSNGSVVSKSSVSTLGFEVASALRTPYPLFKPTFCVDFAPGPRIAVQDDDVVIDTNYALSFVDPRSPFGRCEEGRIFFDASTGEHVFRGIAPGDVLHRIGLRNGDRDPLLCNRDPLSRHQGQCHALTDFASFSAAFPAMIDGTVFDLTFQRATGSHTVRISLANCPEEEGITDCTGML